MNDRFLHRRLRVFRLALDLAVAAKGVSDGVPRGYRSLADQLIRSGSAVALLVAEGANRHSPLQKRQRFVEARGECGEAVAAVEVLSRMGIVSQEDWESFLRLGDEIAAMLTGLVRRHS